MKTLKLLVSSLFLAAGINAQMVEEWSQTFGGGGSDYAYSVQQTTDGGYILAGHTSSFGEGSYDAWLIKTDADGVEEWSQTFGGADLDYANSVQQTSDGGYIIAGYTRSFGEGSDDAWLIKTDADGVEEWSQTFGGSGQEEAYSLQQTTDGGYIIAGYTRSFGAGNSDAWLIKTDANGVEEWSQTFGGTSSDDVQSVQQTSDGGYILAGKTYSFGAGSWDAWVIKADTFGVEEWSRTFGGGQYEEATSVQQTTDSGYIIAGHTRSYGAGSYDAWLIKTDANGVEDWNRTFGGAEADLVYSVQQNITDGYILAGRTNLDAWLIMTDANGVEYWSRTFDWAVYDEATSVQPTIDGGYILSGYSADDMMENGNAWLLKFITVDRGPVIDMDMLVNTVSSADRSVGAIITDDNPSGGVAGVASASLFYSVDGGDAVEVAMNIVEADSFVAVIPGQLSGSEVTYWVQAIDQNGNSTTSVASTYSIYNPSSTLNVPTDYATIQAGLNAAVEGETVLVQPGVYYENIFWPETNGIKLISAGDSGNTIIDGGGLGSVIYMNPQSATIDTTTLILGFKITNGGSASGAGMFISNSMPVITGVEITSNAASSYGGGMYLYDSSPMITSITILGNSANRGGGIYIAGSSPIITGATISGNTADGGGGMYLENSTPTITDVTITENIATISYLGGGGMSLYNSNPVMIGITISGNTASNGGGMYLSTSSPIITGASISNNTASSGGGMYLISSSSPIITNVSLENNYASSSGGGMRLDGSNPILTDVIIIDNATDNFTSSSGWGGGLSMSNSDPVITGGAISDNTSSFGGGLTMSNSDPVISDVSIIRNTAGSKGGGMYLSGSNPSITSVTIDSNYTVEGGGMYISTSSPMITDVTFTSNYASRGAGIYLQSSSPTITGGTISENNGGGGMYLTNSSPIITGVSITNNAGGTGGGMYLRTSSPTITNVSLAGNNASYGGGMYLLQNSSPTFTNVTIINNNAGHGGGMYLEGSSPTISDVSITGNNATWGNGGGMCLNGSSPTITGISITGNNASGGHGGGIYLEGSSAVISDVSITKNMASIGGGMYLSSASPTVETSIIYSNSNGGIYVLSGTPTISGCAMLDNGLGVYSSDNTNFLNVSNNYWGHSSGPYHPMSNTIGQGDSVNVFVNIDPWLDAPSDSLAGSPSSITAVSLKTDSTYQSELVDNIDIGDSLFIEVSGIDTDTLSTGLAVVWVINTGTQDTVVKTLVESTERSGLFRGCVHTAESTDEVNEIIEGQNGQVLRVISRKNPNQQTTVIIGETPLPILTGFTLIDEMDLQHVVNHNPAFSWSYADPLGSAQASYQVQVSSDVAFASIDMWDSVVISGTDTSIAYGGSTLTDGTIYYARLQVVTVTGIPSNYSEFPFRMNSPPEVLQPTSPLDGIIIADNTPLLEVENGSDAESDGLTYYFQLSTDENFSSLIDSTNGLPEGSTTTAWQIENTLNDNYRYWWRARVNDGFEEGVYFSPVSFILNAENDAPEEFALLFPGENGTVGTLRPALDWATAFDPDPMDTIRYTLYLDTPAPGILTYSMDTVTVFQPDFNLIDHSTYHWKVVGTDEHGGSRENTGGYQSFTVNTSNDLPVAFNLLSPVDDVMVTDLTPEFLWEASSDPDDATIVLRENGNGKFSDDRSTVDNSVMVITGYDFYLSTDAGLTDATPIEVLGTSYVPIEELLENHVYYWVVSALDDSGGVTFSDTASFWTNSLNDLPSSFSMLAPVGMPLLGVTSLTPTFTWTQSNDVDLNDELIYRLNLGTSTWDMEEVYVGSETSWTPSEPLWDNTVYSWQVLTEDLSGAITVAGIGDSVAFAHFYTNVENDNPEPAVLLSPDSVMVLSSTPTFIWERSFDPDPFESIEYEVHWWYEGSEWDSVITEETLITISNPLTTDNQQYFWQVISMDDEGGIAHSEDYMFWVDFLSEPPGLFSLVGPEDESAGNSTRPELTWQEAIDPDPFDNIHYQVSIATDSSMSDIVYEGVAIPEIHVPETDLQNDTRYYWQVLALDDDSLQTSSEVWTFDVGYLAVDDGLAKPTEYALEQNYPNPFNPSTTLRYGIPEEASISLIIYDIRGNTVKTFTSEKKAAGWYEHLWNGLDNSGQPVSTGLYLTRLQAGSYTKTIKMLYLK